MNGVRRRAAPELHRGPSRCLWLASVGTRGFARCSANAERALPVSVLSETRTARPRIAPSGHSPESGHLSLPPLPHVGWRPSPANTRPRIVRGRHDAAADGREGSGA